MAQELNFELPEELELFRRETRAWVDRECPKDWAREAERQEHEYPFDLWDKLTAAGYHGIGIAGGATAARAATSSCRCCSARELARSLGGLAWIWGITSFAGAKSIGLYGSDEQKQRFLPAIAARQAPLRDRLHRAGRRHRRARRDADDRARRPTAAG